MNWNPKLVENTTSLSINDTIELGIGKNLTENEIRWSCHEASRHPFSDLLIWV